MTLPLEEVWINKHVAKVILRGARDKPGIAAEVFEHLAEGGINAELIVSGPPSKGRADIAFLVLESQIPKLREMEENLLGSVDGREMIVDTKVALMVFYGGKELSRIPGVAARIFDILAAAGVNIEMISTSIDSLSLVVREDRVDKAVEALREGLGIEPQQNYPYYE